MSFGNPQIVSAVGSSPAPTPPGPPPAQGFPAMAGPLASTGPNGYTKVNGTNANILSWTAPNDGQLHRITVMAIEVVTAAETGGTMAVEDNGQSLGNIFNAGQGTNGPHTVSNAMTLVVLPGHTITLQQTTALTAGAAVVYAEFWGS